MTGKVINSPELSLYQVMADILIANSCLEKSRVSSNKLSKCLNVIEQWCLELQKNGYK